jgi:hypothetical protein
MARKIEYVAPPEAVKDFQKAYDGLLLSKDILDKMRESGDPKPDLEARNKAAIERIIRRAKAFKMKLET